MAIAQNPLIPSLRGACDDAIQTSQSLCCCALLIAWCLDSSEFDWNYDVTVQTGITLEACTQTAVQGVSHRCGFDVACTQVLAYRACFLRSARALAT